MSNELFTAEQVKTITLGVLIFAGTNFRELLFLEKV